MYTKAALFATIVLAAEAVHHQVVYGRSDHIPRMHHDLRRQHEAQFQQFVGLTRSCLIEVFPRTGLPEDQQRILLDMIRPIPELEREHRRDFPDDGEKERSLPRPPLGPPPPPFKCTELGEVIPLTPAELYVRAANKILDRTDKIAERKKAQDSLLLALPCMDRMFRKDVEVKPIPGKPVEHPPVPIPVPVAG
ncbi:uncharacterized protein LOC100908877 [Galendromus occidentalis]|uniref:Uncharacterized protein LOC100908877 n=1 Tax=Galendromus occidentalis TaxID=34638 RepID=A0AAJ6QUI3_9ACAR|nr:uncharacterized protein LOC100908877 [Galendromus occidentalis]